MRRAECAAGALGLGFAVHADRSPESEDGGGLVVVHGLATFAWDGGDEAGRRLAAVQLVRLRAASQVQVALAFGVNPATIWRWDKLLAGGGVGALIPDRRGPRGASRLTAAVVARITELDAEGQTLSQIAGATGVSTFSVRNALGRVRKPGTGDAGADAVTDTDADDGELRGQAACQPAPAPVHVPAQEMLPVLPDPVARGQERVLSRFGLLGEGAQPVFAAGARYPLAGLLLALPTLEATGLVAAARQVYGSLKNGYYGLTATLLTLVFLALAGEPRAGGRPGCRRRRWAGCWAWIAPRKSRRSAASWPSSRARGRPTTCNSG